MKWLVVLCSLYVCGQAYAEGLCKRLANDQGMSNLCIADWNGSAKVVAYAGALSAMLDKFSYTIIYDSYHNDAYWFGYMCSESLPSPTEGDTHQGCSGKVASKSKINTSLANAFLDTLVTAATLESELEAQASLQLRYMSGTRNLPELRDKLAACGIHRGHREVAPLWNNFADNYQREYRAYKDKYRKKIIKTYFNALKRLYGIYAARMKKLMKKVGRDYDCDL